MEPFLPSVTLHIVNCLQLGPWWRDMPVKRSYWRLYQNQGEGASILLKDGREVVIEPGRFYLTTPEVDGLFKCEGCPRHFYIHFGLTAAYDRLRDCVYSCSATAEANALVKEIVVLVKSKVEGDALALSLDALQLVAATLRQIPPREFERILDSRILGAMTRIETAERALRNCDLAKGAHLATNAFARLFRQQTGKSPQEYSLDKRLARAAVMLEHGGADLKRIAESCGFCDVCHFSRTFKANCGMTPAAFRKARRAFPV